MPEEIDMGKLPVIDLDPFRPLDGHEDLEVVLGQHTWRHTIGLDIDIQVGMGTHKATLVKIGAMIANQYDKRAWILISDFLNKLDQALSIRRRHFYTS